MENESLLNRFSFNELQNIPMFFVVGSPRSGTTMLQHMLDANPNIQIPLESRWFIHLYKQFAHIQYWDNKTINLFIKEIYKRPFFVHLWNVDRQTLTEYLLKVPPNKLSYPTIIKIVYLSYSSIFDKNSIKWIGDKNPEYTLYIDMLAELFPDAKFIHIVRDYRPNIISNQKWLYPKNFWVLARKWVVYNDCIEKLKSKTPKKFHTIKYEDLASKPEETLKSITEFLDIDYNSDMINYHLIANNRFFKEATPDQKEFILKGLHKKIFEPISDKWLNEWKSKMKTEEIEIADYIAGDYASKYNYQKQFSTKSFKLKLKKMYAIYYIWLMTSIKRIYHRHTGKIIRKILWFLSQLVLKIVGVKPMFQSNN